jgi:hypothetical protein
MHDFDDATDELAWSIFRYALNRVKMEPPLDGPRTPEELFEAVGQTITEDGLGGEAALEAFTEHLAPACMSVDHPRFLAFVPGAPTDASMLFDLVVGASGLCATSWLDAAGAVYAENQALRWVADLVGLPDGAGGCFASGGTMGNLSALIAARDHARRTRAAAGLAAPSRWAVVASQGAHSSIDSAARVLDVDLLLSGTDEDRRLRGDGVRAAIDGRPDGTEVFAVVATSGTTNLGVVDALDEVADAAAEHGCWFHVDGAYGAAALVAPSASTGATRSSSTPTSGCLRRLTAARCSTGTPRSPGSPTPSTPATSTRSTTAVTGTRRTTGISCPDGPGASHSGSHWPCTAPGPTSKRWNAPSR